VCNDDDMQNNDDDMQNNQDVLLVQYHHKKIEDERVLQQASRTTKSNASNFANLPAVFYIRDDLLGWADYTSIVTFLDEHLKSSHCVGLSEGWYRLRCCDIVPLLPLSGVTVARPNTRVGAIPVITQEKIMEMVETFINPFAMFIASNCKGYQWDVALLLADGVSGQVADAEWICVRKPDSFDILLPLNLESTVLLQLAIC
jgi:hypothetical protein